VQVNGHIARCGREYCKTVGSAYVGSNPTPATTCENGPLAAETRPGGPFPLVLLLRHVSGCVTVGRCVAVSTDIWRTAPGQNERCAKPLALPIRARFVPFPGCRTAAHPGWPVLRRAARARRRAGLVRTRGRGGRAAGSARAISSRLHGGDRVCVAAHWDGRPARRRGERRCARISTPRRAAASCTKGSRCPRSGTGSGGAGHLPVVDW
jgi:hypothetical protein